MARVTLRLPGGLHQRLRAVSQRTGMSLNQLAVAALVQAVDAYDGGEEGTILAEQVRHIRTALGDLVVEMDGGRSLPHLRAIENLPDRAKFIRSLPTLSPPLSATIIADREDRL